MRCEFCGELDAPVMRLFPHRSAGLCRKCAPVFAGILTLKNGRLGAREVMISQHAGEPRRKLLELRNHCITVFLSESLDVTALEIESKVQRTVLRWTLGGTVSEFAVDNIGTSYFNRDEMIPGKGFDYALFHQDIEVSRKNLQPRMMAAIKAFEQSPGTRAAPMPSTEPRC